MPTTRGQTSRRIAKAERPKISVDLMKLDIACGQNKQDGFVGIDIADIPGVDIVHDLNIYPWPIVDGSVSEAFCSHYIEHIPLIEIWSPRLQRNQDMLLAFFDELYRILVPGGQVTIVSPYYTSMRCWQDPTHRRAISEATYLYANRGWRELNRLDHYPIAADFDFSYSYIVEGAWASRSEEARAFAFRHYHNAINDIQVTLTKRS